MGSSTEDVKLSCLQLVVHFDAETEVDNLGRLSFLLKQDVVQFQISVCVPSFVHVSDAANYLFEDYSGH